MSLISIMILCCSTSYSNEAEFILACFSGDCEKVIASVGEVDLNTQVRVHDFESGLIRNGDSWTPLTAAIAGRQWHIASFLIGAGADVNQATSKGYHPAWLLAEHGHGDANALAVAKLVLKSGGKVDLCPAATTDSFKVESALHRAVARLDVRMAKLLISNGADPDSAFENEPSIRDAFTSRFEELEMVRNQIPGFVTDSYWEAARNMRRLLEEKK